MKRSKIISGQLLVKTVNVKGLAMKRIAISAVFLAVLFAGCDFNKEEVPAPVSQAMLTLRPINPDADPENPFQNAFCGVVVNQNVEDYFLIKVENTGSTSIAAFEYEILYGDDPNNQGMKKGGIIQPDPLLNPGDTREFQLPTPTVAGWMQFTVSVKVNGQIDEVTDVCVF